MRLSVTFSVKLEKWLFLVADLPRTRKKCTETEIKKTGEGRAKLLLLPIKYANFVWLSLPSRALLYPPEISHRRVRTYPEEARAMAISFPGISYNNAINIANIPRLEDHHKNICTKLCNEINNNKDHVLHELMPERHQPSYFLLRKSRQFNLPKTKTK